jgi:hypothetical protein
MTSKKAVHSELDHLGTMQRAELRDLYRGRDIDECVRMNIESQRYIRSKAVYGAIRNASFNRRTMLKTMGASALVAPFLGTQVLSSPKKAKAQEAEPDNLLLIDWPCGMEPGWTPLGTGKDYMLPTIQGPGPTAYGTEPALINTVGKHRDDILILSGHQGLIGTDLYSHSQGPCSMWTNWTGGAPTKGLSAFPSLDQFVGEKLKGNRPWKSIHPGVMTLHRETGASGISGPYDHWAAPQQGIQCVDDPGEMYMQIAGDLATAVAASGASGGATMMPAATPPPMDAMGDALKNKKKSVIDYVKGELDGAKNKIGSEDLMKLDLHLEQIRGLEVRLFGGGGATAAGGGGGGGGGVSCDAATAPDAALTGMAATKTPANGAEVTIAQAKIVALAFKCGITKVASIQIGESDCMFTIPYEGSTAPMHLASHNMGDGNDAQSRWVSTRWMHDRVADILTVLKETPMGEGQTLLDKTLVVATSEMSIHEHLDTNLPYYIAGGSNGAFKFKRGEHLGLPTDYRISKVNYSIMEYFGLPGDMLQNPSAAGGNGMGPLVEAHDV